MAHVSAESYPVLMPSIADTARATSLRHSMLPDGGVVLAMLSGGADSVALLRLLASGELGSGHHLFALHVNHLLRAEDSERDQAFVEALCDRLEVQLTVERVDVAAVAAEEGLNLEDAGRRARYALADPVLDACCARAGVSSADGRIAVAHTRSDRTETFMMRLAQGAGAAGLTSLRPVRGRVVRPLIDVSRDEVRAYLAKLGQEWREDASNLDTTRLRSGVRHDVLPLMRRINPRFDDSLARTLDVLLQEDELLAEMAAAFARDFAVVDGERVEFACSMMETLSLPMKRRTVRSAVLGAFPDASRLEFEHVEALVEGLSIDGFARDLPGGLRAENRYGTMSVSRTVEGDTAVAPGLLFVPGMVDLGAAGTITAETCGPAVEDEGPEVALVDAATLTQPLLVSGSRPGERMRPLGMDGSKKVSDLLVDAKVPRASRQSVPVVRSGESVVWLAGVRMSEDHKVSASTRTAIRLEWKREPGAADTDRGKERNETTDAP